MRATYQSGDSPVMLGRPESKRKTSRRIPSSRERRASRLMKLVPPCKRIYQKVVFTFQNGPIKGFKQC